MHPVQQVPIQFTRLLTFGCLDSLDVSLRGRAIGAMDVQVSREVELEVLLGSAALEDDKKRHSLSGRLVSWLFTAGTQVRRAGVVKVAFQRRPAANPWDLLCDAM